MELLEEGSVLFTSIAPVAHQGPVYTRGSVVVCLVLLNLLWLGTCHFPLWDSIYRSVNRSKWVKSPLGLKPLQYRENSETRTRSWGAGNGAFPWHDGWDLRIWLWRWYLVTGMPLQTQTLVTHSLQIRLRMIFSVGGSVWVWFVIFVWFWVFVIGTTASGNLFPGEYGGFFGPMEWVLVGWVSAWGSTHFLAWSYLHWLYVLELSLLSNSFLIEVKITNNCLDIKVLQCEKTGRNSVKEKMPYDAQVSHRSVSTQGSMKYCEPCMN